MKILLLDIETAPNRVWSWGMYDQNITMDQVEETSYVLCWSAKWLDDPKILFGSVWDKKSSTKEMLGRMHTLLDQADVVVSYNGLKFDLPVLSKEFIKLGYTPPAPYKHVDCLKEVRRLFRFEMNKLDFVASALGIGSKAKHEGFTLWTKCMAGDKKAQKRMEKYNRQDVRLLEGLYKRILPWIDRHPSHAAHDDIASCPKCGSTKRQQRGFAVTSIMKYPRYQCQSCGGWFRGNKSVSYHPRGAERVANILS